MSLEPRTELLTRLLEINSKRFDPNTSSYDRANSKPLDLETIMHDTKVMYLSIVDGKFDEPLVER